MPFQTLGSIPNAHLYCPAKPTSMRVTGASSTSLPSGRGPLRTFLQNLHGRTMTTCEGEAWVEVVRAVKGLGVRNRAQKRVR